MAESRVEQIAAVRGFSRFYTRQIGLLDEAFLASPFSLSQARVLYELAQRDGSSATELGGELGLDAGYLSRILKTFETKGLLERRSSDTDGRRSDLSLSHRGREAFEPLDRASNASVSAILDRLSAPERTNLVRAMREIERLLGNAGGSPAPIVLRGHRPGDMGWITHRQAVLYAGEHGWNDSFEALVAEIVSGFIRNFEPASERCWIAERDGEILGSVFAVRASEEVAKLRLLYVEPSARGQGLGRRLVDSCIRFAASRGYRTLTLWTNDILTAARRIYENAGFKLVDEERHHSFGKDLVGQTWSLSLAGRHQGAGTPEGQ